VDGRLIIPNNPELKKKLIEEAHVRLGHLGYLKTLTELRCEFFWPLMAKDTDQFVNEQKPQRQHQPVKC
jgi:hypothetical protein